MKISSEKITALALYLTLALICTIPCHAQSTLLLSESFEAGTGSTPPAGWSIEQVSGISPGISFVTTSTYPTITTAFNGSVFVKYNSYNITSGSTRLKRNIHLSTVNRYCILVDFAWYEDPGYSSSADHVDVQWSTDGTTWATAATFNRFNATAGWKSKNVLLPPSASNQPVLYISFLFTTAYGNNCALDMVQVLAGPATQPYITIGTGTSTVGWPYYTFYMGSRTQMIYTADELIAGGAIAGNLNSIGFDVATAYPQVMQNFTIKMGHSVNNTLTGWVTSGLNTVYQQNYSVPGTGWRDITFTTPFQWDGQSNVLLEVCYGDNGSYTSNSMVYGTASSGQTWHLHLDSWAGCTGTGVGSIQNIRPNIRFGVNSTNMGTLTGYVRNYNTNAPIVGAIVTADGKTDTTKVDGFYMICNLQAGAIQTIGTAPGFISAIENPTINNGEVTALDFLLTPGPQVGGLVTDGSTGLPVAGALVSLAGLSQTLSTANGQYITPPVSVTGPQPLIISKPGYDDFNETVNLYPDSLVIKNVSLIPSSLPPGPLSAVLSGSSVSAVNLNWGVPLGLYELIYDDGIQDNFAIWGASGNYNAQKFSAVSYPVTLFGGKVNLGTATNYPSGALPLNPFKMFVYKADGTGGLPGTVLDSITVSPVGFGWADFTFPAPININSGDFYLVKRQGGVPPHAAGIGIDLTTVSLRSYSKTAAVGSAWTPTAGTFMMRAIVQGTGGPVLMDHTGERQIITATAPEGLLYAASVSDQTGYESQARAEAFDWNSMQNNADAPQVIPPPSNPQPATEEGIGANFSGTVTPSDSPAAILFDNGPMVTSSGTGFGGADESVLQAPLTSYGSNFNKALYYKIADDFTITGNAWNISSIEFYGYQTGSTITSSFTAAFCRIFNGVPGQPGTSVIWGDTTTNRLLFTAFTNIYRVNVSGNNQRPIMKIVLNTSGLTLPAGNYWIEFSTLGSLSSGPWCPYVTIDNTPVTGNGIIFLGTANGYAPLNNTYGQGVPFKIYGSQGTANPLSYKLFRLIHGEEDYPSFWTEIYNGDATTYTDYYWPVLPAGPYRWAVQAIYAPPVQSPSAPVFSNIIGKDWVTEVNVQVSHSCENVPLSGSLVKLVNTEFPDTVYISVTDPDGFTTFNHVWKGEYQLTVTRFPFQTHNQTLSIMNETTAKVILLADPVPPSNLTVNSQTLQTSWQSPAYIAYQLQETFTNGFSANQWTTSGGTSWTSSPAHGNPSPAAVFSGLPVVNNYHQYLTSKSISGINAPKMILKYDVTLVNNSSQSLNYLAVELWNGTAWITLRSHDNSGGNIPWTTQTVDISSFTANTDFSIRFHAHGSNSSHIQLWIIDNVEIFSTDSDEASNSCLLGYNIYLNDALSAFTTDTIYSIPPNQITYGQPYNICVKAEYGFVSSPLVCATMIADYLYPVPTLTAEPVECNVLLTWVKPITAGDGLIITNSAPRKISGNNHAEYSPMVYQTTASNQSEALWDILFSWPCSAASEAATDMAGDYIYTALWNGTTIKKYQKTTGTLLETFDIPGVTGIRDLAYDGNQYWYGGADALSSICKMDFVTKTLVATIPTSVSSVRHCGYDPVNNGLWVGGWSDMFLVSMTGATIATGPAQTSAYGSTYDPDAAGPYLWVNAQNGASQCEIQQYKITGTTLTSTGLVHDLGSVPGFNAGLAGGLGSGNVGTKFALIANIQQDPNLMVALELHGATGGGGGGGGTPDGLIGYNVYRSGINIATIPYPDSLFYIDYGLDPGFYTYDITAVYDLTPLGFPGETGESFLNSSGTRIIDLVCGEPLPFFEPWDITSFQHHNWQSTRYWSFDNNNGNPAPSVIFCPDSALLGYTHNLVTPYLNAGDWTCSSIWLDFDVKLTDRNHTGNEHLKVEIFYNGIWRPLIQFSNNGNTSWNHHHINIDPVKGNSFRIRFMATGANSMDLDKWHLDNIHIHALCNPPLNPVAALSEQTTTLTWEPPLCDGQTPGTLVRLFQWAGTPANAYYQYYNRAYGVVYDLTAYPEASLEKLDFHHSSWGITGIWQYKIHIVDWSTFTEIAMIGPLSTTGNDIWETNIPLGDIPDVGGKQIGIMLEAMSNSPSDAYPCFSSDNVLPVGVSLYGTLPDYSSFSPSAIGDFLQNLWIEVPSPDGPMVVIPSKITVQNQAPAGKPRKQTGIPPSDNNLIFNQMTDIQSPVDFSSVTGYNVYRSGSNGLPPYEKLNTSPVTNTGYTDTFPSGLESGLFRYYITSLFAGSSTGLPIPCETGSDTISVFYPDSHFEPIWFGTPLEPMTIMILQATISDNDLEPGDEIAIFDGSLCVGVRILTSLITPSMPLQIMVSRDNPSTPAIDGYIPGHTITYRIWKNDINTEISSVTCFFPYAPLFALETFTGLQTSVVVLNGNLLPVSLILQGINITSNQQLCYNATEVITVGGAGTFFTVQPSSSLTLIAGEKIRMLPGTRLLLGSYVHAYITQTGNYCNYSPPTLPQDQLSTLPVGKDDHGTVSIHPNPTSGLVTVTLNGYTGKAIHASVVNLAGEKIIDNLSATGESFSLRIDPYPSGIYVLIITTDQSTWVGKVVKL